MSPNMGDHAKPNMNLGDLQTPDSSPDEPHPGPGYGGYGGYGGAPPPSTPKETPVCTCTDHTVAIDSVHRRNVSTVASPVILLFDGVHSVLYKLFLATRYIFNMAFVMLKIAIVEIVRRPPAHQASQVGGREAQPVTNITENKLTCLEMTEEEVKKPAGETVISYKDEGIDYVMQHQVNKLKQHHRRAFDLISQALRLDEEVGTKDARTLEMYKKGISELEKGILLQFESEARESQKARKLQHKMKLNLDMAKKRLDWHLVNQERKRKGLILLRCDVNMRRVADKHLEDAEEAASRELKRGRGCNEHSWMVNFPCCYKSDHSNKGCMWKKPFVSLL